MELAPALMINNADTARSILSTLIGSILSLTVFSFSMVMLLLNQASSNFSPRLLPGLIGDKNNQVVLGFYLGTILYNIIILISILPDGEYYQMNGFSILVGIILGMLCLALFVFFIHSISNAIQIDNILESIFIKTKNKLELLCSEENETLEVSIKFREHADIRSQKAQYYQGIKEDAAKKFAAANEVNIEIIPYKGKYLLPNTPLAKVDRKLTEEQLEEIQGIFNFSNEKLISRNFVLGIKQISETGIKAMSPGINDPGTAIITLDYLTELLAIRMRLDDFETMKTDDEFAIVLNNLPFKDLLYENLALYRQYCKHDYILMSRLSFMLKYLVLQKCKKQEYLEVIKQQMNILQQDFCKIENESDRKNLEEILK